MILITSLREGYLQQMSLHQAKLAQELAKYHGRILREAFRHRHYPKTQKVVMAIACLIHNAPCTSIPLYLA